MKRLSFLVLSITAGIGSLSAQQLQLSDQYLVNKYAFSPALSGHNNNFETFLSVRNSWSGIDGAPSLKTISVNGPLMKYSGIGVMITSEEAGIFRTFSASCSYAHHLKFSGDQFLRLGLAAGFLDNQIDLSGAKTQSLTDPVAFENQSQSGSTFDATFGVLYGYKKFSAGLVVPRLVETGIKDNTGSATVYTFKRHYLMNVSYLYYIGRDFLLEPQAVVRMTGGSPLYYEAGALAKYHQRYWLGALYRKNGSVGLLAGASVYNNFAVSYSYGFGGGIQASSSGTHEVTLGLYLGKNKNNPSSIFPSDPQLGEIYYKILDQ